MRRTQIYLTDEEQQGLAHLAQRTGRKQSAIIRQAIDELLARSGSEDKLARIRRAKGIWKGRRDMDARKLRESFDRY
jgi:predicted DNA-binding protein